MYGELRNSSLDDNQITDIPVIINFNNKTITDEFNEIMDSSNGYLKKSLYAPNGKVQSHWGEFINLKVGRLTVDSLETNSVNENTELINHSDTQKRFSWQFKEQPNLDATGLLDYAHDTKMIVSFADASNRLTIADTEYDYPITLRMELDAIEKIVSGLAKNISVKNTDGTIFVDSVEEFGSDVSDPSIVNDSSIVYGYNSLNFEIEQRLQRIEQRLTQIEYRLDTI